MLFSVRCVFVIIALVLSVALPLGADTVPRCGQRGGGVGDCSLWMNPDIIDSSDPTWLRSVVYTGRGEREIWDHVEQRWIMRNAYLFDVRYGGRLGVTEFQLHPEYGSRDAAQEQVDLYAPMLGRLPRELLLNVREVEIQIATADPSGAGANSGRGVIHINTHAASGAVRDGYMEEILMHEGGHTSLDPDHARAAGWRVAQEADGGFLNNYARDYPVREDIAETTWAYFAVTYRPERMSPANRDTIREAIPHRLAYFDDQMFDFSPYRRATTPIPALPLAGVLLLAALLMIGRRARR